MNCFSANINMVSGRCHTVAPALFCGFFSQPRTKPKARRYFAKRLVHYHGIARRIRIHGHARVVLVDSLLMEHEGGRLRLEMQPHLGLISLLAVLSSRSESRRCSGPMERVQCRLQA